MNDMKVRVSIGGRLIAVDGVLLHSAAAVSKWQGLLARAQPLLGSFSSGIGVWGSPGVALAGAAAIGLLEAAVTNANQKQGLHFVAEALSLHERLTPRGSFIPVNQISGIELPDLTRWRSRGTVASELDVRSISAGEKARWQKELGATDGEIQSGFIVRETVQDLVVLPNEFVTCISENAQILIKWSAIETYELIK